MLTMSDNGSASRIQQSLITGLLGLVISSVSLWLVVRRLDWPVVGRVFVTIEPIYLLFAVIILVIGIAIRVARWLLLAQVSVAHFGSFFRGLAIGYMANMLLPARAGELIRCYLVSHYAVVPFVLVLTTVVIERVLDGFFLVCWLALALLLRQATQGIMPVVLGASLVFVVGLAIILVLGYLGQPITAIATRLVEGLPVAIALRARSIRLLTQLVEGAAVVRQPHQFMLVLFMTLLVWSGDFTFNLSVMRALGWQLPLVASILVSACVGLGSAIPSSPGYVGIYQASVALALSSFPVSPEAAFGFSVIMQAVNLLVCIGLGSLALLSIGLRLTDLFSLGRWARGTVPCDVAGGEEKSL